MEWFKRASGLKIFLAVWLLVLLIPVWRLNAGRQWEKEQLYSFYVSHDPDSEAEPEIQTADGAPLDWKPELGLQVEKQRQLAHLYPDDPAAQLTTISESHLGRDEPYTTRDLLLPKDPDSYFQRFENLAKRYPQNTQIRSQWLRDAAQGELLIEEDKLVEGFGISAPGIKRNSWISVSAREKALIVARQGGAAEPDNAFWPWMEAIFSYSLHRPDDALLALQKAGKCTHFDDGVSDTTRRRIAMMQRVQTSDFNDQYYEFFSALLPHLAKSRAAARETMWQANLALKRGEKTKALRIAAILQEAAVPMAHTGNYLITRLVGEAICYVTWQGSLIYGGAKIPKYDYADPQARQAHRRLLAQMFANYASRNGESAVGRRALQLQATLNSREISTVLVDDRFDGLPQSVNVLARFHWLGSILQKVSLGGGAIWFVSFLLSSWKLVSGPERQRGAVIGSAFCVGVTGVIFWAALHLGAVHEYFVTFGADLTLPPHQGALYWLLVLFVGIWILPPLLMTVASHFKRPQFRWTRTLALKALLYFGILFGIYTWIVALTGPEIGDTVWGQFWPAPIVVFWVSLLGASALHLWKSKDSARWIALFFWGALILLSSGVVFYFDGTDGPFYFGLFLIPAICLLVMATLLYGLDSARNNGWLWPFIGEFITRIRIAAATLALMGSVAYFGLILAALPTRHHAEALLDEQLKIGEIAFLEKRIH